MENLIIDTNDWWTELEIESIIKANGGYTSPFVIGWVIEPNSLKIMDAVKAAYPLGRWIRDSENVLHYSV